MEGRRRTESDSAAFSVKTSDYQHSDGQDENYQKNKQTESENEKYDNVPVFHHLISVPKKSLLFQPPIKLIERDAGANSASFM